MYSRMNMMIAFLLVGVTLSIMRPMAHALQAGDPTVECMSRMKLLAPTYQMYIQDYDEFLPPTKSLPHLVKLLKPYARNKDIFSCPATHTDYHANPEIGMIQLGAFKDRTIVPFYFDGKAHDDGQYVVAYLDGHVKAQSQAPVIPPAPKVKHHPAHRPS